jgi:hypothetical protein
MLAQRAQLALLVALQVQLEQLAKQGQQVKRGQLEMMD